MRIITLTAAALLAFGSMWGQKLSPSAEIMLLNAADSAATLKAPGEQMVGAFIKISGDDARRQIAALGGHVEQQVANGYVTATVPLGALRAIAQIDGVEYVRAGSSARLLMDVARADAGVDKAQSTTSEAGSYTGQGVVVGIVDNGFEYGHAAFYDATGQQLRIKRVWNQNINGKAPEGYSYGVEYTQPEEMLAAKCDLMSTIHGSHVAGIAAGGDRQSAYYGVAPDADVVLVSTKLAQQSSIVDGVKYIMDYAQSVGKPCVVNLSIGSHQGPHDGSSVTDRSLDALTGPGRIIVGAAGNEGLNKLHVSKTLTADDPELKTFIGYNSDSGYKNSSAIDIWGNAGKNMKLTVVVVNMLKGNIVASLDPISTDNPQTISTTFPSSVNVNGTVKMVSTVDPDNNCPNIQLTTKLSSATQGFKVGLVVTGDEGLEVNAWNNLLGDFMSYGKEGWSDGDNACTVGEIGGTAHNIITAGSYNTKLSYTTIGGDTYTMNNSFAGPVGDISLFSSLGPTVDGRMKPEVAAPGCAIVSAANQYYYYFSATNCVSSTSLKGKSYYYDIDAGTSMSSPFVAGTIALWLQANPNLTPDEVKEIIGQSSRRDSYTGTSLPNNTWGAGKIDAFAGLLLAKGMSGVDGVIDGQHNEPFGVKIDRAAREVQVQFDDQSGVALRYNLCNALGQTIASGTLLQSGSSISVPSAQGVCVLQLRQGQATYSTKVAL